MILVSKTNISRIDGLPYFVNYGSYAIKLIISFKMKDSLEAFADYPNTPLKTLTGVILDTNVPYHEHITKTVSSCMSCLSEINRTKHIFDKRTLLTITNALVICKLFLLFERMGEHIEA